MSVVFVSVGEGGIIKNFFSLAMMIVDMEQHGCKGVGDITCERRGNRCECTRTFLLNQIYNVIRYAFALSLA